MQKKQGTLIKQKDRNGRTYYADNATGKRVKLKRVSGKNRVKVPDYVYGTFKKPAPTAIQREMMGL